MNGSVRAEQILERSAERWSHHAAVVDPQGSYSYEELYRASLEVCNVIRAAGARPGSIIGLSIVAARSFLATLFGIVRAGCVAIPVAPNLADAERARVISDTGVELLVLDKTSNCQSLTNPSKSAPIASVCLYNSSYLEIVRYNGAGDCLGSLRFPDAAVIRHTSGTTSKSKGVVLSHRAVRERADTSQQLLGVTHDDVVLAPLPLSYHFVASALSCVQAGAALLDCADLLAPEMLAFGGLHGATMIYAAPIQYELMARADSGLQLPTLRRAISTSALLPKRIADGFSERFGVRLTQVYGIIEVGLPLWNELESIESTALGVCKPPYEAIVINDRGDEVSTGETGELAIRGPGLFSGYLLKGSSELPEESAAPILGGDWFLTGDFVTKDELGVILYRGRKKSVINSGGNKIFPEEIEAVLQRSPDIKAVRVSAEPHPLLGSLVLAEVVPNESSTPSVEAWRALCHSELSEDKVPNEFRIVDALPSTGSGKIVRYKSRATTGDV